jgi:molybdopterin-synthase adenylyltransferase
VQRPDPITMKRPRVKAEHAPHRISGNRIRIGGSCYGIAAEMRDPTGAVWTLLQSMDGTRDIDGIVARVLAEHPDLTAATVRPGLRQLVDSGYVEDAAGPVPAELTARDLERHDRGASYYRWLDLTPRASAWEPQAVLKTSRVVVIGVGGTGGAAASALAAAGVGSLHCVDPDVVELSNLNRQVIYTEDDIGAAKADAAVARLRRLNRDIEVTGERRRIDSAQDVLPLARDCDVLLLTADRPPEVRSWTNRACLAAGRPWVDAGYHGPLVQAGAYVPGDGACWECLRAAMVDRAVERCVEFDDSPHRPAAVGAAVAATSAGMSGYLAAHQVTSLLTGIPRAQPGRIQTINLAALDSPHIVAGPRRPDCPACAATR